MPIKSIARKIKENNTEGCQEKYFYVGHKRLPVNTWVDSLPRIAPRPVNRSGILKNVDVHARFFIVCHSCGATIIPYEQNRKVKISPPKKDHSKQQKPEKDERSRIKLDVNNLLALSSLSRTLDCYSRSQSGPHISQHPGSQK